MFEYKYEKVSQSCVQRVLDEFSEQGWRVLTFDKDPQNLHTIHVLFERERALAPTNVGQEFLNG